MKTIIYGFLKTVSMFSRSFRENVFIPELYKTPLSILSINFVFQRLGRLNSGFPTSLHFTSRTINPSKIKLIKDRTTLTSFAVSPSCYFEAGNGIELGSEITLRSWSPNHKHES